MNEFSFLHLAPILPWRRTVGYSGDYIHHRIIPFIFVPNSADFFTPKNKEFVGLIILFLFHYTFPSNAFPENFVYQNEADLNQDHILVARPLSERHDAAVLHRLADDYNELEKDLGLAA